MRLDFELHWYIVTDRSLRIRTGVLRLQEATMSFANLQPVTVTQGPLQRLLGLADVRVQSAGGGGNDEHKPGTDTSLHTGVFHGVANATEIRALILHRLRQFRATGLGDPDDHLSLVGGVPPTRANSSPALAAAIDTLAAAREVLHEAAALRREISAGTPLQRLSFPVTVSTSTRSPASPSMPNTENDASTLDQATLLTTAQLRLSSDVRVSDARSQRAVVKYQPGRNYLVVSPPQFKVLTDFTTARAVPGVLLDLISKRRCPPLREFYELIVKAFHAGILQVADQPLPPTVSPSPWKAQTNGGPARWLAILAMAAATTTLFVRNLELPNETWELLTGWLLSCVAMSLGYAAAACVLKGAGGEIYHPKFHWLTLAPHFRVDLEDVIMTGQKTEIDVALVRMAPQFILAALAALYAPALLLPLLCGVFVVISPFWRSPMLDLLRALYRDPRLSTSYDFMFAQNRLFSVLLRSRIKFADRTFLLVCSSYTLVWLFLLFSAGTSLLNVNAPELFQRFKAAGGLHFTALTLLTLFGAMATCALGVVSWIGLSHLLRWRREKAERKRVPTAAPVTLATVAELLGQTLLFRNLEAEELKAAVGAVTAQQFEAGAYVVREGEPGDRLYVVYSGRVEVLREQSVGEPEAIAELQRGDIFGEMALIEGGIRRRSVRCAAPSVLLSIGKWEFDSLVFSRLSRQAIVDAVQKIGFLRRIPLSRQWSPHALTAFARCSEFRDLKPGEIVFRTGDLNPFFHLVQEGELEVVKDGKVVAALTTGDFFGEISVLQDSTAVATIIAKIPTRCLLVARPDFLEFMSNDFIIGLLFEEIGSKRLGEPIFPFKRRGVSVAHA